EGAEAEELNQIAQETQRVITERGGDPSEIPAAFMGPMPGEWDDPPAPGDADRWLACGADYGMMPASHDNPAIPEHKSAPPALSVQLEERPRMSSPIDELYTLSSNEPLFRFLQKSGELATLGDQPFAEPDGSRDRAVQLRNSFRRAIIPSLQGNDH